MPTLIRPMLAKTYLDGPSCLYTPGMLVQPKLNGIRLMYLNGRFVSRGMGLEQGKILADRRLFHLQCELARFKDLVLDGELYCHGMSLQQINSRARVSSHDPHPDEAALEYHVFDYVSREPFALRIAQLARVFRHSMKHVRLVPTLVTRSELDANSHYERFLRAGYEGMMLRAPDSPYAIVGECGRKDLRVSWLLKRKQWIEIDCVIRGLETGDGKHSNTMSKFVLDWNGKVFKCSSGPSDAERILYYELGPQLHDRTCRIEYRELTEYGTPFNARITHVNLP